MAKRFIGLFMCAVVVIFPLGAVEAQPTLQDPCPELVGRIISVVGGADVNGDGQGDMWFPFKLPIIAGWAIKIKVENLSPNRVTFKIRMAGMDGTNWRFGYNKHWGMDTYTTVKVAAGKTVEVGNFYVQPRENNTQATGLVQLLWTPALLKKECILASQTFAAITDNTPPSSTAFIPATYGQSGYPRNGVVNTDKFEVTWIAEEYQQPAAGVKQVTVEYRTKTGSWRKLGSYPPTQTSIIFEGKFKNGYCFRTIAEDHVGHKEPLPKNPNYDTCVEVLPNEPISVEPPPVSQLITVARQPNVVGGVDLIGVCYAYGFSDARNVNNTADGWQCVRADTFWQVNWDRVCRDVYGNGSQAVRNGNSPAAWRCTGDTRSLCSPTAGFACLTIQARSPQDVNARVAGVTVTVTKNPGDEVIFTGQTDGNGSVGPFSVPTLPQKLNYMLSGYPDGSRCSELDTHIWDAGNYVLWLQPTNPGGGSTCAAGNP